MDPRPDNLEILLRELERRDPERTTPARQCIEAVLSGGGAEARRAAIEAIEALPRHELSLFNLGTQALLELGPEAAPALKRWILSYGDRGYSLIWATLDGGVDAAPGLAAFAELLEEADERLVAAAAAGVGAAGRAAARFVPRLRELSLSLGDSWLRGQAMAALGRAGATDKETIDLLVRAVREGDEDESLHAIAALGLLGSAAGGTVDAIAAHLRDEEIFNACAAANALRRIGVRSQAVGDALALALEGEENPDRYLDHLRAVGELGVPSALAGAALDAALSSHDEAKRAGAIVAGYVAHGDPARLIEALSGQDGREDLIWLLNEWRVPIADAVADVLLGILEQHPRRGPRKMVSDVFRAALPPGQDWPDNELPYLVMLVGRLGERATTAVPALERIAADESEAPWTRSAAEDALKELRPPGGA